VPVACRKNVEFKISIPKNSPFFSEGDSQQMTGEQFLSLGQEFSMEQPGEQNGKKQTNFAQTMADRGFW
tara:strand:- start:73 stop:279 length:207 start_codon:yes stop_codon:yes gene_type:complete